MLIVNGLILLTAERLRRRQNRARRRRTIEGGSPDAQIAQLPFRRALGIGTAQAAALVPGISRSGASMVGGLVSGLNHESAARFSFLLATPVIGAAAVLKLPDLLSSSLAAERTSFLIGAACAAVAAWFSTRFLLRFFETRTLTPFAIYCIVGGVIYSVLLLLGI